MLVLFDTGGVLFCVLLVVGDYLSQILDLAVCIVHMASDLKVDIPLIAGFLVVSLDNKAREALGLMLSRCRSSDFHSASFTRALDRLAVTIHVGFSILQSCKNCGASAFQWTEFL